MRVTANFQGRLGNLLYEVALVLATGWRSKAEIVFSTENEGYYNDHSSYTEYVKKIISDYKLIDKAEGFKVIEENVRLKPEKFNITEDTQFKGYFTSPIYFDDFKDEIIYIFTKHNKTEVDKLVSSYRGKTSLPIIAIHVRRTDYVNEYKWWIGKEYYERAIKRVKELFGRTCHFIILSDDKKWCEENLSGEIVVNKDYIEMQLMGRFDGLIMANSTFSAWGAMLGNPKVVIAPDVWRDTKGGADPYNEFIYEPNWIRV